MKVFLLVLVSEMGDRSQITAVALGAANEVWGVILGGSFVSVEFVMLNIGTFNVLVVRCMVRPDIYE